VCTGTQRCNTVNQERLTRVDRLEARKAKRKEKEKEKEKERRKKIRIERGKVKMTPVPSLTPLAAWRQ
jgi:hypothetical protein